MPTYETGFPRIHQNNTCFALPLLLLSQQAHNAQSVSGIRAFRLKFYLGWKLDMVFFLLD